MEHARAEGRLARIASHMNAPKVSATSKLFVPSNFVSCGGSWSCLRIWFAHGSRVLKRVSNMLMSCGWYGQSLAPLLCVIIYLLSFEILVACGGRWSNLQICIAEGQRFLKASLKVSISTYDGFSLLRYVKFRSSWNLVSCGGNWNVSRIRRAEG